MRILRMHANEREALETASAGDIVALVGLKQTATGDTLCEKAHPIALESITFPEPVISMAIEPKSAADRDRLEEALARLAREDPTFRTAVHEETGQTIISGMGELHLEVLKHRLAPRLQGRGQRRASPASPTARPSAAPGEAEHTFQRLIQGKEQAATVRIRVRAGRAGQRHRASASTTPPEAVPPKFRAGRGGGRRCSPPRAAWTWASP